MLPRVRHSSPPLGDTGAREGAPALPTLVCFTARPGCAGDVARLLTGVAATVADTDLGPLFWTALCNEGAGDEFATFDVFADANGRADFAGKVAAALRDASASTVVGGWEGVLADVPPRPGPRRALR